MILVIAIAEMNPVLFTENRYLSSKDVSVRRNKRMDEEFMLEIAQEYRKKAESLPDNGMQDIGERRKLRIELQERFGLTELVALNVVNGRHLMDMVMLYKRVKYMREWRVDDGRYERSV